MAWTLAAFLTVPVLVAQDVGPVEAVKESAALLKRTWGEGLIGNGGIGLVGGLAAVAVMLAGLALTGFLAKAGLGAAAIGVIALSVLAVVGIGVEGATTGAGGADIVAFASSQGLFAGMSVEGSYIDPDNDWNALYYGQGATTKAIVLERRFTNPGAEPIRQYMAKW